MADVAGATGFSMQTVSRVANGHDNVRPDTRAAITAAMEQLGYRPNRAARSLRSGRFHTIGVITFPLSGFGTMRMLEVITETARTLDYSITLLTIGRPTSGGMAKAFSRLSEQAVDGVVLMVDSELEDHSEVAIPPGLPVVVLASYEDPLHAMITADQYEGARAATQHLLDFGHPTVWHVRGPDHSYPSSLRERAWRRTLQDAGAPVPEVLTGDWSSRSGYEHGCWLAARDEVSAVFASNDQMALGVVRACHEAGRSVPGSVSVVGFDDMAESSSFWPALTTVHQPFDVVGHRSVVALVAEIEEGAPVVSERIPTRLVVRESSGPYGG